MFILIKLCDLYCEKRLRMLIFKLRFFMVVFVFVVLFFEEGKVFKGMNGFWLVFIRFLSFGGVGVVIWVLF